MVRFDTPLCRKLELDVPIVQAPIGGAATPELAAAVSNAGGLGMLALTWHDPDGAREAIRRTRALTERTFGVNLVLEWPQEERLRICLEEGVRLISFFWGDPAPLLPAVHGAGALAALTVGSAEEARRAAKAGVDIIVAQGWEAGGHVRGEVATLPLLPAVVDAVSPLPVVAAGGIADGRGLAAVLALGAAGAWVGTRFVMASESAAHPRYRELLAAAAETDTFHSQLFDVGWPNASHRTLRNSTVEAWLAAGRPPPGERPGEGELLVTTARGGSAVRYASVAPTREATGDLEALPLWSGQGVGLISEVKTAADIVAEMAGEAADILRGMPGLIVD